jgi:hypothetical protein
VTFSDLEVVLALAPRVHGYVRDNIPNIWRPGGEADQKGYSRELAGALLREEDVFFDRALALYLLRSQLKSLQACTWAGVASYYSNYFSALSFIRLYPAQLLFGDSYARWRGVRCGHLERSQPILFDPFKSQAAWPHGRLETVLPYRAGHGVAGFKHCNKPGAHAQYLAV